MYIRLPISLWLLLGGVSAHVFGLFSLQPLLLVAGLFFTWLGWKSGPGRN